MARGGCPPRIPRRAILHSKRRGPFPSVNLEGELANDRSRDSSLKARFSPQGCKAWYPCLHERQLVQRQLRVSQVQEPPDWDTIRAGRFAEARAIPAEAGLGRPEPGIFLHGEFFTAPGLEIMAVAHDRIDGHGIRTAGLADPAGVAAIQSAAVALKSREKTFFRGAAENSLCSLLPAMFAAWLEDKIIISASG